MLERAPHIVSINISPGGIPKLPVKRLHVSINGLDGDGHNHEKHRTPIQAVCLQDVERLDELNREGYRLVPGATGENLTVANLNVNALPVGTQLKFSNGVVVELTKVRKPCYVLDAISPRLKEDLVGRCGIYAKVIRDGVLSDAETIAVAEPLSCQAA